MTDLSIARLSFFSWPRRPTRAMVQASVEVDDQQRRKNDALRRQCWMDLLRSSSSASAGGVEILFSHFPKDF